jgi:ATP-dependent Clp protease adapter protein ClpS
VFVFLSFLKAEVIYKERKTNKKTKEESLSFLFLPNTCKVLMLLSLHESQKRLDIVNVVFFVIRLLKEIFVMPKEVVIFVILKKIKY